MEVLGGRPQELGASLETSAAFLASGLTLSASNIYGQTDVSNGLGAVANADTPATGGTLPSFDIETFQVRKTSDTTA